MPIRSKTCATVVVCAGFGGGAEAKKSMLKRYVVDPQRGSKIVCPKGLPMYPSLYLQLWGMYPALLGVP